MNRFRTGTCVSVFLFMLIPFLAFSSGSAEKSGVSGSRQAPPAGFPAVFTDDLGDTLTLNEPPRRIISGTLMSDEILLSLTGSSRVAAVTQFATDSLVSNVPEEALKIRVRGPVNIEQYVALEPDLIFLADWTDAAAVRQLKDAGLPIFRLSTPSTFAEIEHTVSRIAEVIGEAAKGRELIARMNEKLASVREKVATIPDEKRLTVMDYSTWGTAMGKNSSWDEIVRAAGLVNAVAGRAADEWGSVPVSKELLLELDPDILVLPGWTYGDPTGADAFFKSVVNDPALAGLTAVRNGNVIRIPEAHSSTTTHFMVLAVEDLAREAYPELFR